MKDWKTTLPGLLAAASQAAKLVAPQYAAICDGVTALAVAVLGFFAKQA